MPSRRFEDTYFANVAPPGKVVEFPDAKVSGLWARIKASGRIAFFYRYTSKLDGKRKRVAVGNFPGVTTADARSTVSQWNAWLLQTKPGMTDDELRALDPWARKADAEVRAKRAEKRKVIERRDVKTLADAWARYTKLRKPDIKDWSKTASIWNTHFARFADRPIIELTSEELEDYLMEVRDGTVKGGSKDPAPYAAARAHDLIKAIISVGAGAC